MRTMKNTVNIIEAKQAGDEFCAGVIESSGQPVYSCYQCQRCGGGCPVAAVAGTTPNQFLRLLQLGLVEEAMENPLLWLCVGCSTCGARCPNLISTNEVIDQFRALASRRRKIAREVKGVRVFHKLFLKQVRRFGRLHEASLIGSLKMRTRSFFKDMGLGLKMFRKGKIPVLPHRLRGIPGVKSIFRRRRDGR